MLSLKYMFVNIFSIFLLLSYLPTCMASPTSKTAPFPKISFKIFSEFILKTFNPEISLSTVLMLLFSIIENPELIMLHNRQRHSYLVGEKKRIDNGWIRAFIKALTETLSYENMQTLFQDDQIPVPTITGFNLTFSQTFQFANKLDNLIELLGLTSPIDNSESLHSISKDEIQPIRFICPSIPFCPIDKYHLNALDDIMSVYVVSGLTSYKAYSLGGSCAKCKNQCHYYADHISYNNSEEDRLSSYINSAHFLRLGQKIWAERNFGNFVLQAMYAFHGSAATIMDFWNRSSTSNIHLTRRHIWQAFAQASIRLISFDIKTPFLLPTQINPKMLLSEAFSQLGNNGIINIEHYCSKCTHRSTIQPENEDEMLYVNMIVIDGLVVGPTVSI